MGREELSDLIETTLQADSVEALHRLCSRAAHAYGFEHFIYGARFPSSLIRPFMLVISGHPDEWRARYQSRHYIARDPAVRHCVTHTRPVRWSELLSDPDQPRNARQVLEEAKEFGLLAGTSLPVRGSRGEVGLMSFSGARTGREAEREILAAQPDLFLLSSYVHEAVCRIVARGEMPYQPVHLTKRERECLLWSAEGKTAWETAQILGLSERTVVFHLNNAASKLAVTTRQQAVARAVSQGLIAPSLD